MTTRAKVHAVQVVQLSLTPPHARREKDVEGSTGCTSRTGFEAASWGRSASKVAARRSCSRSTQPGDLH